MAKAFILAGLKFHIETETPMKEFMWRPGSTLRPPVVADSTILVKEMVVPASASVKVIDSFQTQSSTSLSSSGGTVVSTVTNISEAAAKDTDATYTWLATNPHNGSVRALSTDSQKMVAWDWNSNQRIGMDGARIDDRHVGDGLRRTPGCPRHTTSQYGCAQRRSQFYDHLAGCPRDRGACVLVSTRGSRQSTISTHRRWFGVRLAKRF